MNAAMNESKDLLSVGGIGESPPGVFNIMNDYYLSAYTRCFSVIIIVTGLLQSVKAESI